MSISNLSLYQQYIHMSRYSRWNEKEKRRETWPETVDRYLNFFTEHLSERHQYNIPFDLKEELRQAITDLEVMPSMRAMWAAGPALKRDEIAGYNCLSGDTLVTTLEYGIVPIKAMAGKSVHVVDGNGEWTKSLCSSHGNQQLYKVSLSTSGTGSFSVRSTADHRWILRNGGETLTSHLKNGDTLACVSMPARSNIDENSAEYSAGIVHGIVYGDGVATYKSRTGGRTTYVERVCNGFAVRLCGTSRPLLRYFNDYNHSYSKSYNGDPVVYIRDRAVDLKSLPDVTSNMFNDNYLVGFIRGWLAADGSVTTRSGQVSLTSDNEGYNWIMSNGPRLGFNVSSFNVNSDNTNFKRTKDSYNMLLDRRWLVANDFLLEYKRDRFKSIDGTRHPGFGKIASVELDAIEEVFCFDVPTTHSFLLTKNLLTGNCAYIPVNRTTAFDEILYLLMNGTGVGFSVERQYINELPVIAEDFHKSNITIVVEDNKAGWAKALKEMVHLLYAGQIPDWDVSKLRPAGAILKTFGGRSSGPDPLVGLFRFVINMFRNAAGRRLNSLECHDLVCKIADVVIVGGVRRSALISLSNLSDDRMRYAKSGNWWETNKQRELANNSAAYTEKPDIGIFMKEWLSLYESKSGERGIFNRQAARKKVAHHGRRNPDFEFGVNPCVSGDQIVVVKEKNTEVYHFITVLEVVIMHSMGIELQIKSFNTETNSVEYKDITNAALTREEAKVIEIIYDDNKPPLVCTPDHIVYTKNRGWVAAADLLEDDELEIP